jgi:hypothetical protein
MFRITRQHTTFYCDLICGQDVIRTNNVLARRQRVKPTFIVNSKPKQKYPWSPTVRFCNPDNTCDGSAREQSAYVSHSPTKRFRAVITISRASTYVATGIEQEMCVFRFGQVSWTVRKAIDLAAGGLPYERRGFVHEELSKRFTCACKVEVHRMYVCSNLPPSR